MTSISPCSQDQESGSSRFFGEVRFSKYFLLFGQALVLFTKLSALIRCAFSLCVESWYFYLFEVVNRDKLIWKLFFQTNCMILEL